ncbi:MAG: MucB/RseB C-terminal domain-containing protein [Methylomonas sp.]|nr:MucB/RseB C-terminal domain-containing protein [Methylomonas sp.]
MRFFIVFFLAISCAAAQESSSLNGQQWLKKVGDSMKTLNYHGTVIFMKNGQIDTMKYQHTVENGIENERLTSLNSPLREVTRKSNEISCIFKETHKKIESQHPIDRSFIVDLPAHPERLDEQYLLAVAGQEMIAMRPAQIIAVLPKDELRYARKIWVDKASWLPLKIEVYALDGSTLEQVLFTEFEVDTLASDQASAPMHPQVENRHLHAENNGALEDSAFRLGNWPAGFKEVFFIRNAMQQSKKIVDHLLLSDGFSNISVYFEPKGEHGIEGLKSLGPVNSFSRVVGDLQVTVLGEVPSQAVEFVANGVSVRRN